MDVVPLFLRSISKNHYLNFVPLNIPTKEKDNIMDENHQKESIGFKRWVLIGTLDNTYD